MLLKTVLEEYVGTAARLVPMVKLLCGQMQNAFQITGLTCPPWRRADSMIGKWVPSKVRPSSPLCPSSSLSTAQEELECQEMILPRCFVLLRRTESTTAGEGH